MLVFFAVACAFGLFCVAVCFPMVFVFVWDWYNIISCGFGVVWRLWLSIGQNWFAVLGVVLSGIWLVRVVWAGLLSLWTWVPGFGFGLVVLGTFGAGFRFCSFGECGVSGDVVGVGVFL